ncbi:MAG: TIGR03088 family PEP-CTERM/XrtA system glycosyltransferase [Parahaliea sp.]
MTAPQPPLVAHIIYALGTGGLENGLVHIINGSPPGRYRHAIVCLTAADDFARRITRPNVAVHQLHMRPGTDWSAYRRLRRLLRELKPAIVHSRNLAPLEAQLSTLGLGGIRRVHGEHGRDMVDLDGSNLKYRIFRRAMRHFIHHYIAVSRDLADWLVTVIGIPEQRMTQIYNGVDVGRFQPGEARAVRAGLLPEGFAAGDDTVIVGTVGRFAEVKDQVTLLQGVAVLLAKCPELRSRLRVMLVGDGTLRPKLEEATRSLGLEALVWMPGDRDDVPQLLQCMDLFVLPSLGEGISNTILEAMASGLPVIATRVGGNPELVSEGYNGELFPVGDTQALAGHLEHLLTNRELREQYSGNALAFVRERFSWPRTIDHYLDLYDRLLKS